MAYEIIFFDPANAQAEYQYMAMGFDGELHIGYVYIEKPWYSPESKWSYYIRSEEYKNHGLCGGAESSGFNDVLVIRDSIKPFDQIAKVEYALNSGFIVKLFKRDNHPFFNEEDIIAEIHPGQKIPYELWRKD